MNCIDQMLFSSGFCLGLANQQEIMWQKEKEVCGVHLPSSLHPVVGLQ
jgi:hypothetical protein